MKPAFWKDKRVLITGHEGFLGSNLTKQLLAFGARITGIDIKVNRENTLFNKDDYKNFETVKGSITNYSLVRRLIEKDKIEFVFHLAAKAIVGECTRYPLRGFASNIEGTWKVLEASRNAGSVKAVVIASSDKAYGCHTRLPYRESTPLVGRHPYDVSKSCADLIAYAYSYTYGVPVAVTRCGNIYGPGDLNFSRIAPYAVRCALKGKAVRIRSDGKFTRDYIYVDDVVNGYMMLAEQLQEKDLSGEAFNFSGEEPVTVIRFIDQIYKNLGKVARYTILNEAKYEIKHQYLSSKKAGRVLGWRAKNSLREGLRKTIEWYKEYYTSRRGL